MRLSVRARLLSEETKPLNLALCCMHQPGPLPDALAMCRNLEYVWLNGNKLVGKIPERYGALTRLDTFSVEGNLLQGVLC